MLKPSSPHLISTNRTTMIMLSVIGATLPGLVVSTLWFGIGSVMQVLWCTVIALATEAWLLYLRKRPILPALTDGSAALTGVLLGLALPALAPWWIGLVATAFAIIFAKHVYGGLGNNPFNPAMVGYALVLVSFPVPMTTLWPLPAWGDALSANALEHAWLAFIDAPVALDAYTGATTLDALRHTTTDPRATHLWGSVCVNAAFLVGGVWLLWRKLISWHIPVSMLGALLLLTWVFSLLGAPAPAWVHASVGATMLGAFFIATDPVSSSTTARGKLWFGAGIGVLVAIIRTYGNYPDAVAFAVLLMNFAAPFIDAYTQPRTYGHTKPKRGLKGKQQP